MLKGSKKRHSESSGGVHCLKCLKTGHWTFQCPLLNDGKGKKATSRKPGANIMTVSDLKAKEKAKSRASGGCCRGGSCSMPSKKKDCKDGSCCMPKKKGCATGSCGKSSKRGGYSSDSGSDSYDSDGSSNGSDCSDSESDYSDSGSGSDCSGSDCD